MEFNVAQLLKEPIGANRRYELVETIENLDPDLEILGPLVGNLQLTRIHSGILAIGQFSTAVRVSCNRCLEPLAEQVRFELEESFRPLTEVRTGRFIRPDEFEGEADELEDEALIINEQHIMDIGEVVRQNIWLAMSMISGCNWAGEGDCPNWLVYIDEVQETVGGSPLPQAADEEVVDPRWAALLALQNKLDGDDSGGQSSEST